MIRSWAMLLIVGLLSVGQAARAQAPQRTPYRYLRVGNAADVSVKPRAGYALMGGGKDLDEAFKWLCDRANGGDFLVVRATGTDAYNPYVQGLCKLNSVATLIIPSKEAAMDPFVARTISHAGAIFIAGGDQANYINFWMGTPAQTALNDAIRRGVPIGGTSAGLAVMGEFAYTAQGDTPDGPDLDSKTALADPYNPRVALVHGFLDIPALRNIATDTHFARRDRMGRLLVFLARLNEPGGYPGAVTLGFIRAIGIDEGAAVLLGSNGKATVVGHANAYFLQPSSPPEVLRPHTPLSFAKIDVQRIAPGGEFNLSEWRGKSERYTLSVDAGLIHSTQPNDVLY
ncbi:MAG: cyanophycinase [Terracidiphilus sp.]